MPQPPSLVVQVTSLQPLHSSQPVSPPRPGFWAAPAGMRGHRAGPPKLSRDIMGFPLWFLSRLQTSRRAGS